MLNKYNLTSFVLLIVAVLLSGCAGQNSRAKSSVVDYLYPKNSDKVVKPSIPVLELPIRLGIAFVPEQPSQSYGMNFWSGVRSSSSLSEAKKTNLLNRVADHFREREFIDEIEVIPSAYLITGGGFSNLDQIQTMYGIDVIALVSYDQVQFTDEGMLSLTYWTLIGAYIVSGEKNDTSTMIDTAVYDIKSRKMLFRAPGTSNVKGRSTPVNLSEELRADSSRSFDEATSKMTSNLSDQLDNFREKVKNNPEKIKIIHSKSYTGGGGGVGPIELVISLCIFIFLFQKSSKRSSRFSSLYQRRSLIKKCELRVNRAAV